MTYKTVNRSVHTYYDTPVINESVFKEIPELLVNMLEIATDERERDMLLLSILTVSSGCFTRIVGIYDRKKFYAPYNLFIVAPAGSGKGIIEFSKKFVEPYCIHIKETGNGNNDNLGIVGNQRNLFIPGNSSAAGILYFLSKNNDQGLLFETEADTLSTALKNDFGNFSDVLRKAFHHEKISSYRKKDDELIELNCPKLAIVLSGTPNQVGRLIQSGEDGLLSRFSFYIFQTPPEWKDVSIRPLPEFNQKINEYSQSYLELIKLVNSDERTFDLTEDQWNCLNQNFAEWLENGQQFGCDASSMVKRLGLIMFRLCMVLTCFRIDKSSFMKLNLTCTDADFNICLSIIDTLVAHSMRVYQMVTQEPVRPLVDGINAFFRQLPDEFERKDVIKLGKLVGFATRTIDKYLNLYVQNGALIRSGQGQYKKAS